MVFPACRRHSSMRLRWVLSLLAVVVFLGAGPRLHAQEGQAVQARLAQDNLDAVRQAAEQGDVEAQYNLGAMYGMGLDVPLDDAEAARWYRLAADQGEAVAQHNLGFMYAEGRGVVEDADEAVRWYRLAAAQGLTSTQHKLGLVYDNGEGVPKDNVLAYMWFYVAAANGHGPAMRFPPSLERSMTRTEIRRATDLARECMASLQRQTPEGCALHGPRD